MANLTDVRSTCFGHKYVLLSILCGCLSSLVGSLMVIIYALIRSNTSSLQYFETIPTYIVALLLILNGLIVICFAKSGARREYLVKLIGGLYLLCALLSVIMTVTTSVVHLSRLQPLTGCFPVDGNCLCLIKSFESDEKQGLQSYTFKDTIDCDVVQGLLSTCLRGLFGLSVASILICIFSLMLVYQLLSHQKKKKYLQQLELRRRFQTQNRGNHSTHSSYPSSHISPILHHQSRNHSLRNLQINGYYDENTASNGVSFYPHSYDYLDNRCYNNNNNFNIINNIDDDNIGIVTNRANVWTNWLNWPRNYTNNNNNHISNQTTNGNNGWFRELFFRNRDLHDITTNNNHLRHAMNQMLIPPHVFIPRIGSDGLSQLPTHIINRHQNNQLRPHLMRAMNSVHRRTRSNDGIFQHMNVHNLVPIERSYNANNSAINNSSNMFAMWGPPPPYTCSQPQSLNRINTICNNINNSSGNQHCRQLSVQTTDVNSSKISTPMSERRFRTNASQGIRQTDDSNDKLMKTEKNGSCIVEIHVQYEDNNNNNNNDQKNLQSFNGMKKVNNLWFNTLPSIKRNDNSQPMNPFKSLSNIPITVPNGLISSESSDLTDSEFESNKSKLETIRNAYHKQVFDKSSLSTTSTPTSTSNTSHEVTSELSTYDNTSESFSASSFPVDPPTDYKSILVIQTPNTQSTPLTEKSSHNIAERYIINSGKEQDIRLNSAQSMPNLSCIIPISSSKSTSTRTQPHFWELHRIPSSGNTSTSQDIADFELDLDEESIKMVADLPIDDNNVNTKTNTDSSTSSDKTTSETTSMTPEILKPPTPFNNQNYGTNDTSSTATLSSLSEPKPELIINITGIQV